MNAYLIFHVLAEMMSIIVAWGILTVAWNSRRYLKHSFFLFLGIAYATVGSIDLVHTLAYKGMGVFSGFSSNEATQLWIAARYLNAFSLLLAPLFLTRQVRPWRIALPYLVVMFGLLASVFAGWFPDCYREAAGLTTFKIISEYIICIMVAGAMVLLWRRREHLEKMVLRLLLAAMALTIATELAFTLYTDVYGFFNALGHLLKIAAFACLYKAVVATGLWRPYDILFRDLHASEERYRSLVSDSPDAIIVEDEGRLLYANAAALHLYKAPDFDTLAARDFFDLIASEARSTTAEHARGAAAGITVPIHEGKVVRLDGVHIPVEIRISPVNYDGHHAVQMILRDLSARLIAEQQLQHFNEELRKSRAATLNLLQDAIIAREQAEQTGEKLRQSEHRLRLASAAAQLGVFEWEPATDTVHWENDQMYEIFGRTREEGPLSGKTFYDEVLDERDKETFEQAMTEAMQPNKLFYITCRIHRCSDNQLRWIEYWGRFDLAPDGSARRLVGIVDDITESKQVEDALRESEQRLRAAAQAAHFGTYDADLKTGTLYWSSEMRSILGVPQDASTPAPGVIPDFIHPDDVQHLKQMFREAFDPYGSGAVQNEHRIIRPDGSMRWVMVKGQVDFEEQNGYRKPIRSTGIMMDVTERKQVEEALRQSREDLERAQSVGGIGSWRLDIRQNKLTWSAENHRIFGIPKGTPMTYETFLSTIHPDDREYVNTQWQGALKGWPYDIEHRIIVGDEIKWIREKAYLEFDENNDLVGGFGISQDITQRKHMQEELRKSYDEMEERIRVRTAELAETVDSLEAEVRQRIAAEKAVEAERKHFRDVLDGLPAYVILLSDDYHIRFANRFFEEHFGIPDKDKTCYEFLYGRDEPCEHCVMPEVLKTGSPQEWEWAAPDRRDYFVRDFLFTDTSGITQVMEMGIDITDRKQAQERIRLTNILLELFTKKTSRKEYLDAVIEVIRDWTQCECIGIRLLDAEGRIPYEAWIGFSEEFLACEAQLSLHDDACLCIRAITQAPNASDRPLVTGQGAFHSGDALKFLQTLSEEEKTCYRGNCMRHGFASLAVVPIRYRSSIIGAIHLADKQKNKMPPEAVEFLESMAMLVGEAIRRFNVEQSLQESRSRLLEAQRMAHIGNWEWVFATGRILWSDEVYRIMGITPADEFDPSYEIFLSYVHPEDRSTLNEAVEIAKNKGSYALDHRIIKPDGMERIIHEIAEVMYDRDGKPVKMTGTMHDITEQKQAEQAIREHQQALRAMAAELQLAEERQRRQIAQDLHDSIGPILAFSTRELRTLKNNIPPDLAANVENVTEKIDMAIQQARTLSFDLSPSLLYDLGLEVAVEDLVDRFAGERKIICRFRASPESKPLTEDVKIILYRSVRELLINAAKHAEPSQVEVIIERTDSNVCIRVEDDGLGFDVKMLDEETEKKGFGLFSIRERLNHIGGDLQIESAPGKGTIMILTAPLDLDHE